MTDFSDNSNVLKTFPQTWIFDSAIVMIVGGGEGEEKEQ